MEPRVILRRIATLCIFIEFVIGTANTNQIPRDSFPNPYLLEVDKLLSDPSLLPTISNGHIATSINDNCIKMNALFTGNASESYPACIPSPFKLSWKTSPRVSLFAEGNVSMATTLYGKDIARTWPKKMLDGGKYEVLSERYQLDLRNGLFNEFTDISSVEAPEQRATIVKHSFMHRAPQHCRIHVVRLWFDSHQEEFKELVLPFISLTSMILTNAGGPAPSTTDLDLQKVKIIDLDNIGEVCVLNGITKVEEFSEAGKQNVSMVWTCAIAEVEANSNVAHQGVFRLRADKSTLLMASISVDEDDAIKHFVKAWHEREMLLAQHQQAWNRLWSAGRVEIDASRSLNLSQAVAAAQYYLWSDVRLLEKDVNETAQSSVLDKVPYMGLASGGLAKAVEGFNYYGHIFWDMDTWMFPSILWTQPVLARQLLRARAYQLDAAKQNAQRQGDNGARFPWESARHGWEVSPWAPSALYEIHVSCDISMALKLYFQTTGDIDAIERYRFGEMAFAIAEYYFGRSVLDANGTRHIYNVMGPDEYHAPVNDSVYTNYCAAQALRLPQYLCSLAKRRGNETHTSKAAVPEYCTNNTDKVKQFSDAAQALVILMEEYNGRVYHPEFAGFVPRNDIHAADSTKEEIRVKNLLIKQADVILLQYPLMSNDTSKTQLSDLQIYEEQSDFYGPALTWAIFAINQLELGRSIAADKNFRRQFANILPRFGMWSESPTDGVRVGAVNFLTGMGGFLQSVVNGYFGLRIDVTKYAQYGVDLDIFNCFRIQPRSLPGNVPYSIYGLNLRNTTFNVEVTDEDYAYVTLDTVPQNVKKVSICNKLLSSTCTVVEAGAAVAVGNALERFICLTFA